MKDKERKRRNTNNKTTNEKQTIRASIFGNLKKNISPKQERLKQLEKELDEDNKGRISIKQPNHVEDRGNRVTKKTNKSVGKGKPRHRSDKNYQVLQEEYEKDYVWIRRELEGYAPLRNLDIWNKIKTSIRYMDEKSGKTARKKAEQARIENMKRIKIESEIKKKISDFTEEILESKTIAQELEIVCKPEYVEVLKNVLMQEYFTMFNISLVEINPNLKRYGINPPILLNITKKGVLINE